MEKVLNILKYFHQFMEFIGISQSKDNSLHVIKPKINLFSLRLFPKWHIPEIILTKQEAIENGYTIPKKKTFTEWLFNDRKGIAYTIIDKKRVVITVKED